MDTSPTGISSSTTTHLRQRQSFIRRPVIHQYLRCGIVYNVDGSNLSPQRTPFDIFVDLLLSCIVSVLAADAMQSAGMASVVKFALSFYAVWSIWSDHKNFMGNGHNDDFIHRMYTLCTIPLLVGICVNSTAVNINTDFERWVFESKAISSAVYFLLVAKALRIATHLACAWYIPEFLISQSFSAVNLLIASLLYLVALFSSNLTACAVALSIGYFIEMLSRLWIGLLPYIDRYMTRQDRPSLPVAKVSVSYSSQRKASFVSMTLGQIVARVLFDAELYNAYGLSTLYGRSLLVLLTAFSINWLYYAFNSGPEEDHALNQHWLRSTLYSVAHWPLCAGLILAGAAVPQAVHSDLMDSSSENYWGGGLSLSLTCLVLISLTHKRKFATEGARKVGYANIALQAATIPVIGALPQANLRTSVFLLVYALIFVLLTIVTTIINHWSASKM